MIALAAVWCNAMLGRLPGVRVLEEMGLTGRG
jgi:hypothetical protein